MTDNNKRIPGAQASCLRVQAAGASLWPLYRADSAALAKTLCSESVYFRIYGGRPGAPVARPPVRIPVGGVSGTHRPPFRPPPTMYAP
ncbi:hypothetical protein IscW_ISCW017863 [Ixodes scapularis]|uniref:Uncharacterized protein n=1 Tax=Ixodes scapularis TaxID=6945 RepID=B7PH86_IXOSC|nr:hypothetical protein IscW_ISCW017863 [Ixodes scapularis]|eukprot:XP_002402352.1 hypothetical protein IscW_ISCW017863 [Ixodes scapularis]